MKKIIYSALISIFLIKANSTQLTTCDTDSSNKAVCIHQEKNKRSSCSEEQEGLIYFAPGPIQF